MQHLKEWARGKPLGLAIVGQQLAVSTEGCFEFLRLIKSGEKIEALLSILKAEESLRIKELSKHFLGTRI